MDSPSRDELLRLLRRLRDAAEAFAGSDTDRMAYDELDAALNEVNGALDAALNEVNGASVETESDKADNATRPSRWIHFARERIAHGYWKNRVEDRWDSLCGTHFVERFERDRYSALQFEPPSVPSHDDPSGCCLRCWARSFPKTRTLSGALRKRR